MTSGHFKEEISAQHWRPSWTYSKQWIFLLIVTDLYLSLTLLSLFLSYHNSVCATQTIPLIMFNFLPFLFFKPTNADGLCQILIISILSSAMCAVHVVLHLCGCGLKLKRSRGTECPQLLPGTFPLHSFKKALNSERWYSIFSYHSQTFHLCLMISGYPEVDTDGTEWRHWRGSVNSK